MVLQTIFYPIEMFARRREGISLRIAIDGRGYDSKSFGRASYLDCSAILNKKQLSIFACNRSLTEPMDLAIRLGNARISRFLNGEIVNGADPRASNTFEAPNRIISRSFGEAL